MLKPTFTERTALEIRDRIIKWLREHFAAKSHWTAFSPAAEFCPNERYNYLFPRVRDLALSGIFDDTAESIVLRVLKDMNNFGTVSLMRDPVDSRAAESFVILSQRLLAPLSEGVHFNLDDSGMYTISDFSVLD